MLKQVTSKRPVALLALLTLAVALLVVGANSAYATHDGGDIPLTLPFFDTFGSPPSSNDVIHWDEIEDQNDYCATKNTGGNNGGGQGVNMALQLSNGCDAYVTFEVPYGASLFLEYDWGYHTTGGTADDGDLEVRLIQLVRSSEPDTLNTLSTYTNSFQPRQAKSNTGPIYPESVGFNLLSLGLQTETEGRSAIIQIHFVGSSTGGQDWGWVDNVRITRESPLPLGTVSYTQGYYGNAGEAFACEVLAAMDRYSDDEMSADAVYGITAILSSPSVGVDLGSEGVDVTALESEDVRSLCLFLVGAEGINGSDGGFLPAGKVDGVPTSNLAAQDITLRVNLNLDLVYGEWGVDEGVEFRPIEIGYYLNIDPVLGDPIWGDVYPLENTYGEDEALGACGTGTTEGLCAASADAELTTLGVLVQRLDDAGTTVGDMLDAADALLMAGATNETTLYINTMELTQIDVTNILSLINKSYDEGVPTGFVTAWDYDPVR